MASFRNLEMKVGLSKDEWVRITFNICLQIVIKYLAKTFYFLWKHISCRKLCRKTF